MSEHRNILFHGLGLTLRRLPALLWAYVFNLALALLFSLNLHHRLADVTSHSLASQRLISGFDLGAVTDAFSRLNEGPSNSDLATHGNVPLYFILFFLLVPGTIFCYLTKVSARLSTLLQQGLLFFWRFIRITILTLLVSALILGPLFALQKAWATHVDNHAVGFHAFLARLIGLIVMLLTRFWQRGAEASLVLQNPLPTPDSSYPTTPITRRATFTDPAPPVVAPDVPPIHSPDRPHMDTFYNIDPLTPIYPAPMSTMAQDNLIEPLPPATTPTPAPIPNPEPASPSLDEPDPGVFHHDPIKPPNT